MSDSHIVRVALFATSSGHAHEACTLTQFGQRSSTCITHARAQSVGSDLYVFDVCVGRGVGINERRRDRCVDAPAFDDGVGK